MTTGESSCRPARLERFDETIGAICDGLVIRAGLLDDALATYRATCDVELRAPTVGTGGMVRGLASGLRDMGNWTGAVGAAFRAAAEAADVPWGIDAEDTMTLDDRSIVGHLAQWDDPYRGVAEGAAAQLARDLGADYDPDEPPAWVDILGQGGNVADVLSPLLEGAAAAMADARPGVTITMVAESASLVVLADGSAIARFSRAELTARLMLPSANAARLSSAALWVGRAGNALAFVAGAGAQWYADAGLPTPERLGRAVVRGGGIALGGAGGGVLAGLACGPGAPVCSTVLGITFAFGGAWLGDKFVDALPFMDSPEPGEHDLGDLTATIASEGDAEVDLQIAARADLAASDLALLATADDPALNERVTSIIPDEDLLWRMIEFDDESPPSWVANGTTTSTTTTTVPPTTTSPITPPSHMGPPTRTTTATTTTAPPAAAPSAHAPPDPWVGDGPGS
jgi:cell division septation protein DedD